MAAFLTGRMNGEGVFTGEVSKRKEEIGIKGDDDVGVLEGKGGGGEV